MSIPNAIIAIPERNAIPTCVYKIAMPMIICNGKTATPEITVETEDRVWASI